MVIKSGHIELHPYTLEDAASLQLMANNAKISDRMRDAFPHPYSLQDAEDFIKRCMAGDIKWVFAIIYKGTLVGSIGIHLQTDVYSKTAELGYFVSESHWNKGIARKSVEMIVKYGFESLHLTRIFAGVFENNKASMKVLEKNGFVLECIKRKAVYKNKQILDEYYYAKVND